MFIVGRAADDLTAAQQHIHFQHGFVRQSEAERRRFNANTPDCPADGDRFQLRHYRRHQAVGQCGIGQGFVSHHSLGFDHVGLGID